MAERSIATRSGRSWPHNAIYEILTNNTKHYGHEPVTYSQNTVALFYNILDKLPPMIKRAYLVVYRDGRTLFDASKVLKISPTTIRNRLSYIYKARDKSTYTYYVSTLLESKNVGYNGGLTDALIPDFINEAASGVFYEDYVEKIVTQFIRGDKIKRIAYRLSISEDLVINCLTDYRKFCEYKFLLNKE